jgi:hypothetical protein
MIETIKNDAESVCEFVFGVFISHMTDISSFPDIEVEKSLSLNVSGTVLCRNVSGCKGGSIE